MILINFMKLVFYRYLLAVGPISLKFNLSHLVIEAYSHSFHKMNYSFDSSIYCFFSFDKSCTISGPIIPTLQSVDIHA